MKSFKCYFACTAIFLLLFSSCSKEETIVENAEINNDVVTVHFGPLLEEFSNQNDELQGDLTNCSFDGASYAQIKLIYGNSNTPIEVIVEILEDDQGLFTAFDEALEIPIEAGETTVSVTLTDFLVWDDDDGSPGSVIWVAPKEDSEYAKFVSNPLSNTFNLRAGSKNYLNVDVICYDDRDVNLYGYQFFNINPTVLTKFCVFANYCVSPDNRDSVANYSLDLYTYSGKVPEDSPIGDETLYNSIYSDQMPVTGNEGTTFYADPLCLPIPVGDTENPDDPYLYYEITLEDWEGYYGTAPEVSQSGYLTWNQILTLLNNDGNENTVDYLHFFLNCPGAGDPNCQIDSDHDGVPNCYDNCSEVSNSLQTDTDGDGIGDACDYCPEKYDKINADSDGDGIGDLCDSCPNDATNSCNNGEKACESAWMFGDHTFTKKDNDDLSLSGKWGWAEYFEVNQSPEIFNFYAAAGNNNTSNGYLAGQIEISKSGSTLTIEVRAEADVDFKEIKIYTSYMKPPTASPGQFDKLDDVQGKKDASPEAINTYTFNYPGDDPIWIAVHGDVCGKNDN